MHFVNLQEEQLDQLGLRAAGDSHEDKFVLSPGGCKLGQLTTYNINGCFGVITVTHQVPTVSPIQVMFSIKFTCRGVPDAKVFLCRYVHKSYYDALGLTPKASQVDIKNAYYKMSMVYHPDKGAANSARFQEISTAYEVLGNIKLRKLYDKGMLPTGAAQYAEAQEESKTSPQSSSSSYSQSRAEHNTQSRAHRNMYDDINSSRFDNDAHKQRGPHTGKTQHYDFDAWTKAHYSETFARQYASHEIKIARKEAKIQAKVDKLKRVESLLTTMLLCIVLIAVYGGMGLVRKEIPHKPVVKDK